MTEFSSHQQRHHRQVSVDSKSNFLAHLVFILAIIVQCNSQTKWITRGPNLITNGDFSTPQVNEFIVSSVPIDGWTSPLIKIYVASLCSPTWKNTQQVIALNPTPAQKLTQQVVLAGGNVLLSFYYASRCCSPDTVGFRVYWNNQSVADIPYDIFDETIHKAEYQVKSKSGINSLVFESQGVEENSGFLLSGVEMRAIDTALSGDISTENLFKNTVVDQNGNKSPFNQKKDLTINPGQKITIEKLTKLEGGKIYLLEYSAALTKPGNSYQLNIETSGHSIGSSAIEGTTPKSYFIRFTAVQGDSLINFSNPSDSQAGIVLSNLKLSLLPRDSYVPVLETSGANLALNSGISKLDLGEYSSNIPNTGWSGNRIEVASGKEVSTKVVSDKPCIKLDVAHNSVSLTLRDLEKGEQYGLQIDFSGEPGNKADLSINGLPLGTLLCYNSELLTNYYNFKAADFENILTFKFSGDKALGVFDVRVKKVTGPVIDKSLLAEDFLKNGKFDAKTIKACEPLTAENGAGWKGDGVELCLGSQCNSGWPPMIQLARLPRNGITLSQTMTLPMSSFLFEVDYAGPNLGFSSSAFEVLWNQKSYGLTKLQKNLIFKRSMTLKSFSGENTISLISKQTQLQGYIVFHNARLLRLNILKGFQSQNQNLIVNPHVITTPIGSKVVLDGAAIAPWFSSGSVEVARGGLYYANLGDELAVRLGSESTWYLSQVINMPANGPYLLSFMWGPGSDWDGTGIMVYWADYVFLNKLAAGSYYEQEAFLVYSKEGPSKLKLMSQFKRVEQIVYVLRLELKAYIERSPLIGSSRNLILNGDFRSQKVKAFQQFQNAIVGWTAPTIAVAALFLTNNLWPSGIYGVLLSKKVTPAISTASLSLRKQFYTLQFSWAPAMPASEIKATKQILEGLRVYFNDEAIYQTTPSDQKIRNQMIPFLGKNGDNFLTFQLLCLLSGKGIALSNVSLYPTPRMFNTPLKAEIK